MASENKIRGHIPSVGHDWVSGGFYLGPSHRVAADFSGCAQYKMRTAHIILAYGAKICRHSVGVALRQSLTLQVCTKVER